MKRLLLVFALMGVSLALGIGLLFLANSAINDEDPTPTPDAETSFEPETTAFPSGGGVLEGITLQGSPIDPPFEIDNFSVDQTGGGSFAYDDYAGKVLLIYFGYMTCPDFCPTSMADLQRAYRDLEDVADDVQVVFFTVDPERDSMALMSRYVAAFDEDFLGLRTDDTLLMQTIMNQFGVVAARRDVDSAVGYLIDHTASIFMVDTQGRLINRFQFGTPYTAIVHDVREVLAAQAG